MKYTLPKFLNKVVSEQVYRRWLQRKAAAHFRRDAQRHFKGISISLYKMLIQEAVIRSNGVDAYTGEKLDWKLISKYRNEKTLKKGYKKTFSYLPTVDHCPEYRQPTFEICSWKTNDMKGDMTRKEFLEQCKKVIRYSSHA